jgi:SH3-like domain-containing protein
MAHRRIERHVSRVAHDYTAQYRNPITVRAGDRVQVGRDDPEYPGWRWCTGPDGREGWVPEEFIKRQGEEGVMLRDYTAQELDVRAGAEVSLGEATHGWVWATDAEGRAGWIPLTCLSTPDQ